MGWPSRPSGVVVGDPTTGAPDDPKPPPHTRADVVLEGIRTANGRVFAVIEPGLPDGFRLDVQGYIFTSSLDSVQVYTPAGERIGKILVPEKVGNLVFGGPSKDRLFIAASSSLYRIDLNTRGLR